MLQQKIFFKLGKSSKLYLDFLYLLFQFTLLVESPEALEKNIQEEFRFLNF